MQHLYGVSFRGKMLYFSGSISDDRVKEVEEIANQIDYTLEEDAFCRQLENAIRYKLGIEFNHQPVEHIFRVKKNKRLPTFYGGSRYTLL